MLNQPFKLISTCNIKFTEDSNTETCNGVFIILHFHIFINLYCFFNDRINSQNQLSEGNIILMKCKRIKLMPCCKSVHKGKKLRNDIYIINMAMPFTLFIIC